MFKKLSEAPNYTIVKEWLENNLIPLENNLNEIEHLSFLAETPDRFDDCFNLFISIIERIPLVKHNLKDVTIIRARPNYNDQVFSYEHEISYNSREKDKIKSGRFNAPQEPTFYGCLPIPNENINQELNASLESCKELIFNNDTLHIQDMTFSEWIIDREITVVNLCFSDAHLKSNPGIKKVVDEYDIHFREHFNPQASRFVMRFLTYVSHLSCTNKSENCYYVLTALFKAIDCYYSKCLGLPFDGVIYPSAMTESKGLNIALHPEAVDSHLRPNNVIIYRYCKVKNENRYFSYPISDIATIRNGIFELKKW